MSDSFTVSAYLTGRRVQRVAFAGARQVVFTFDENSEDWLPWAALAVRWMPAQRNKAKIRADLEWGRDKDGLIYSRIEGAL